MRSRSSPNSDRHLYWSAGLSLRLLHDRQEIGFLNVAQEGGDALADTGRIRKRRLIVY